MTSEFSEFGMAIYNLRTYVDDFHKKTLLQVWGEEGISAELI